MSTANVMLNEFEVKQLLKNEAETLVLFMMDNNDRMIEYVQQNMNKINNAWRHHEEYAIDTTECLHLYIIYLNDGNKEKADIWHTYYLSLKAMREARCKG